MSVREKKIGTSFAGRCLIPTQGGEQYTLSTRKQKSKRADRQKNAASKGSCNLGHPKPRYREESGLASARGGGKDSPKKKKSPEPLS